MIVIEKLTDYDMFLVFMYMIKTRVMAFIILFVNINSYAGVISPKINLDAIFTNTILNINKRGLLFKNAIYFFNYCITFYL